MIQRIQTIFMLLSILGSFFLFLTSEDTIFLGTNLFVRVSSILLIPLGGYSVFSFKNRKRQLLLNNISIGINALLIALLMFWLLNLSGGINFPEKGIEPIFPLISIVCLVLANIYIKKDERLVKSVDRLR
jgi:hypothetical protein